MQNNTFSTLFVGQNLITLSAVDSTNNYLKNLLSKSEPLPEGTVIMADEQFAGRGQQENIWHAEPGKNLTISILLKPKHLKVDQQFLLNMVVSLALNEVLSTYLPKGLSIKWPNDIYYNDLKLGGILIENSVLVSAIKTTVIGIGLNVNQLHFSQDIEGRATSIKQILQVDVNLELLLKEICSQIENMYLKLIAGNYTFLRKGYVDKLYRIGVLSKFSSNGVDFEGQITGVNDHGLLRIERDGKTIQYNFKEIEFKR